MWSSSQISAVIGRTDAILLHIRNPRASVRVDSCVNIRSCLSLRRLFPRRYRQFEQSGFRNEFEGLADWLKANCYRDGACRYHLGRLYEVLVTAKGWAPEASRTESDLSAIFRKKTTSVANIVRYRSTQRVYREFLLSQGRLIPTGPSNRFVPIRQGYRQYLVQFRDLAPSTLQAHDGTVADFLRRVLLIRRSLRTLRRTDVEQYVQRRSRETTRRTLQNIVTHLRKFLRYCHDFGQIHARLDEIDLPRVFRGELPPRALDWPTIKALLRSIDRRSRSGWRDYTILHLMAYYGLRSSEIISLRLDSIDWKSCTLRAYQSKTRSTLVLPLARQTLAILRRYVAHRADQESQQRPELFLRQLSPHIPVKQSAITTMFARRVRQSKLQITEHSPYSLRHGFAMRLLARGVGIKAIGDVMGHRDLRSTCMYLRLDTKTLRHVALPVPRAAGLSEGKHE